MGKPERVENPEPATVLDRRRRNLGRKIRLASPDEVRRLVTEAEAEAVGLGNEWRARVDEG